LANFSRKQQKSREFQRFLPPKPEMKAFIVFLSDNIFNFEAKEAKKFFFEAQIQRISEVFAPQTGNEGFYCVFK